MAKVRTPVISKINLMVSSDTTALARTITTSAISQTVYKTEKKVLIPESCNKVARTIAAIIEQSPNPNMAASNNSISFNFFPLAIARGIAIKANG